MAENTNGAAVNNQAPALNAQNEAPVVKDPVAEAFRHKLQGFNALLNLEPPAGSTEATPDGKAQTVLISHIEMQLDQLFFGLWSTENFKWSVVANEVVGSLDLVVIHPVTDRELRRTGAASVQIMVDAVPPELKDQPGDSKEEQARKKRERNEWALNTSNKKATALDKDFPKLKAECLKNAAQSFGKTFGRDLNRKVKAESGQPFRIPKARQNASSKANAATNATADALNKQSTNVKIEPK